MNCFGHRPATVASVSEFERLRQRHRADKSGARGRRAREAFRNDLAGPRLSGGVLLPADRFAPPRALRPATKLFWLPTKPDDPPDETVLKPNRAINIGLVDNGVRPRRLGYVGTHHQPDLSADLPQLPRQHGATSAPLDLKEGSRDAR